MNRLEQIDRLKARVMETGPLVDPERAAEIRRFHIDLAQLQFRYGLQLIASDDHIMEIVDARRDMPPGYTFSAIIREDGKLEVIDWVQE